MAPTALSTEAAKKVNHSTNMARPARVERATLCLEGRCSIQLSYGRNGGNLNERAGETQEQQHGVPLELFPANQRK